MDGSELALAKSIGEKASSLGYESCGIVGARDMAGYADKVARRMEEYPADRPLLERFTGMADIRKVRPWAGAVVVLVRPYGKYRTPDRLKGRIAKAYLCGGLHVEGSIENTASRAFGEFLAEHGIRAETERRAGLTAMRWAAAMAGLGIIRKNNFFYGKGGSWVNLEAWLIDRELELKDTNHAKPCPDNCRRCLDACPTQALRGPYSMRPTACIAFTTGFGGDNLADNPSGPAMSGRIYGCDACQSACPFNQAPGREEIDYPGLDEFAERMSLTNLIDMDHETLRKSLAEKFWYISGDRLWKWKTNALNAMKNEYKEEYMPWIRKACDDPSEPVRTMAAWVLRSVEGR